MCHAFATFSAPSFRRDPATLNDSLSAAGIGVQFSPCVDLDVEVIVPAVGLETCAGSQVSLALACQRLE